MATHNFKIFNESFSNTQTDAEYLAETQRAGGLVDGIAKTQMHNKLFRQMSVMVYAIADFITGNGYDISDADANTIATALSEFIALKSTVDAKQATITGAATTITSSNLAASKALISDSSGKVAVSAATATELGYVSGVTSAIQTQLNTAQTNLINHSNLTAATAHGGLATATQGAKADAALPAASYTAADVLAKMLTVDGSGSGLDTDTNRGAYPDESPTAYTIMKRNSGGYAYATYFNGNAAQETSAASSYIYETGDGFFRKKPLANVLDELSGRIYGSASYSETLAVNSSVTRTIPLGSTKYRFGKMHVYGYSSGAPNDWYGIVFFGPDSSKAMHIRTSPSQSNDSTRIHHRSTASVFELMIVGNYAYIQEAYINGSNLVLMFTNNSTSYTSNLTCTINWEVW